VLYRGRERGEAGKPLPRQASRWAGVAGRAEYGRGWDELSVVLKDSAAPCPSGGMSAPDRGRERPAEAGKLLRGQAWRWAGAAGQAEYVRGWREVSVVLADSYLRCPTGGMAVPVRDRERAAERRLPGQVSRWIGAAGRTKFGRGRVEVSVVPRDSAVPCPNVGIAVPDRGWVSAAAGKLLPGQAWRRAGAAGRAEYGRGWDEASVVLEHSVALCPTAGIAVPDRGRERAAAERPLPRQAWRWVGAAGRAAYGRGWDEASVVPNDSAAPNPNEEMVVLDRGRECAAAERPMLGLVSR
jgi:hypothetical protein